MINKKSFQTIIASPPEYEKLVAEIHFGEKFIALINQEKGSDSLEIEFPGSDPDEDLIARSIPLREFLVAIEIACKRLKGELQ